jgi:hypothetical protein
MPDTPTPDDPEYSRLEQEVERITQENTARKTVMVLVLPMLVVLLVVAAYLAFTHPASTLPGMVPPMVTTSAPGQRSG